MKRKVVMSSILIFMLAACGSAQTVGPEDLIETSVGKEFKVILDSNPSTGYHWEVVGELDKEVVELVSKDYRAEEPVMPGSGGSEVWVFKAVGTGETRVTLGYYPPSNDPTEPEKMQSFTVKVE